jgi:hypothetical protein
MLILAYILLPLAYWGHALWTDVRYWWDTR